MKERVVIPTVVHDSETWLLSTQEKRKIEVFEVMCLRNICGIRRVDRVRNTLIREKCGCELSVMERIESNVLKWFGHVERMGEERLVKKVYQANGEEEGRKRLQRGWRDEKKHLLIERKW